MDRAMHERKRTGRNLALALALAAGFGAGLPAAAKTIEPEATAEGVLADYTVYIGGLIVAEGSMKASLEGESYRLQNRLGSAGLPKKFWDARWTMTSEGRVDGDKLRPSSFAFTSTENDETKKRLLTYNDAGMPALSFDPPLSPEERESTLPFERKGTLDPVSTFLVPVANDGNPCNRKLPVFDGKRRYDLDLTFDRIDTITTRNNGYSGEAVRCKVRITPRAGMEKAKLTKTMQQRDDTRIWLAPVDSGKFYFPVRVQMRTPIGGAVLDVVRLRPLGVNTAAADFPSN
ncbi:MAG: DUF3108 domain-containing protein [Parvibaculum sp.]|uniref:DUF3108 domain-containing protein n=1 Tax=Parvibaculum sp. TaxID=2024848 RepID=UPI002ABABF59|nr:DUF3108 domain-containing protein [Parvibaculum sp.]MDZ4381959.1 DUF3108 domain-containing protein [Parvibaculum sp.]